jgi:stringent starvation protein B
MTSTRPYLIRAFYDWIVDNHCTPHVVVNANFEGVEVPKEYVQNSQIILNIAFSAAHGLKLGEDAIEFQARFGGKVRQVYAPHAAVLAIYARENGRGMVFAEDEALALSSASTSLHTTALPQSSLGAGKNNKVSKPSKRPSHLRLVKSEDEDESDKND